MRPRERLPRCVLTVLLSGLAACAPARRLAIGQVADALAGGGEVFARDDDPELVRQAIPFALKTYESLLEQAPRHRGLLVAAASGFSQYAYAFVQRDAELREDTSLAESLVIRRRAQRLFLRGRDYALRALEARHPGITAELGASNLAGLARATREDVAALYWAGAAWGGAVSVLKDDPHLIGDLPAVKALLDRVLALDPTFDRGGAHLIQISLEAGLAGGSLERARAHFDQALALGQGATASPWVAYAETVAVQQQDRALFERLLGQALAIDPDRVPHTRLANLLAQERARWLLGRTEHLFFE